LQNSCLNQSFDLWCDHFDEHRKLQVMHLKSMKVVQQMERISNRIVFKALTVALNCWHEQAGEEKRLKSVVRKIVQKVKRSALLSYFDWWVMQAWMESQLRSRACILMSRHTRASSMSAYCRLREYATLQRQLKNKARHVEKRLRIAVIDSAFERWMDATEDADKSSCQDEVLFRRCGHFD